VSPEDLRISADSLESAVRSRLGTAVSGGERSVGGGSINRASRVKLDDGRELFIKENSLRHAGLFEEEARGLLALRAAAGPRVPEVYGFFDDGRSQFLLLEWIEAGSRGAGFFSRFGRELAGMHRSNRAPRCGFDRDNHIGATEQQNRWLESWHEFFAERRIGFQVRLARDRGLLDRATATRADRLATKLPNLLPPPDDGEASILHGDLWGGNYLADDEGAPVLIDPAVYYGHRETDLAMTELFGGFGGEFYRAYEDEWPLEPGYRERRDLYNLYHLLNHLNLFGRSYLSQCVSIIHRFS